MKHSDHELNIAGAAFWLANHGGAPIDLPDIDALLTTFGHAAVEVAITYLTVNNLLREAPGEEAAEVARIEKAIAEIATADAIRRAQGGAA